MEPAARGHPADDAGGLRPRSSRHPSGPVRPGLRVSWPGGEVVPNVVAWLDQSAWDGIDSDHVMAILGRAHGDLHPDNILLPMSPVVDASAYRLIDLSDYSPDAALTRDLVHLTLAV